MKEKVKMCIYQIQSKLIPQRLYIGSTVLFRKRKTEHFGKLRRGVHENMRLQNHANKYGIQDLQMRVLTPISDKEGLLSTEQHYLTLYEPYFNIKKLAYATYDAPQSEETKRKRVESRKANAIKNGKVPHVNSEEAKKLMSLAAIERFKPYSTPNWKVVKENVKRNNQNSILHIYECTYCKNQIQHIRNIKKKICKCQFVSKRIPVLDLARWRKYKNDCIGEMSLSLENFNNVVKSGNGDNTILRKIDERLPMSKDNYQWVSKEENYYLSQIYNKGRSDNTTGYAGVVWDKEANRYRARVKHKGKLLNAGFSNCPHDANKKRIQFMIREGLVKGYQVKALL